MQRDEPSAAELAPTALASGGDGPTIIADSEPKWNDATGDGWVGGAAAPPGAATGDWRKPEEGEEPRPAPPFADELTDRGVADGESVVPVGTARPPDWRGYLVIGLALLFLVSAGVILFMVLAG